MTKEDFPPLETKLARVGNYRMTGKTLGKGSFAVVQEAVHTRLKIKVSVKTIELAKVNTYVLKHLEREAAILMRLEHPHVMRLFETMKSNQHYWLVCELLRGGDLCGHLRQQRGRRLNEASARRISRQVASALAYLHRLGVVHRDLKLENIMLDSRKENVKLVDFGLSAQWAALSPLRTLCGSPDYCAPELFQPGRVYGPEVDQWALGVVLFAMAAGRLPFPGVSGRLKTAQSRMDFLSTIGKGLTKTHTDAISNYSPDFTDLVKALMNPCWEERLTAENVLKDAWVSNRNHWTNPPHPLLDARDRQKIFRKIGAMLEVSPDSVRAELKQRPCGEVAGLYNIFAHHSLKQASKIGSPSKLSLSTTSGSPPLKVRHEEIKGSGEKVWMFGAAKKINQVTQGGATLRQTVTTSTRTMPQPISTISQNSQKNGTSGKITWRDVKLPALNRSAMSTPKSTNKMQDSLLHSGSGKTHSTEPQNVFKFKRGNLALHDQPILPSKLNVKFLNKYQSNIAV